MNRPALILYAFLVGFTTVAKGQQDWLQGWRDATIAIGIVDTGKAVSTQTGKYILKSNGDTLRVPYFKVVGTGVIFGNPDTLSKTPLLVTAKHVFDEPNKNWHPSSVRLRFSWFADKSVSEYLGIEFKLKDRDTTPLWRAHPTESVDLAVIPLVISREDAGRPSVIPVRVQNFADTTDAFEGASVLLLGYPGAVGPDYWTKPIVRHGIIAHVDQSRFGKSPLLIDAMVFPGNSGGPVFTVPTGMTRAGSFAIRDRAAFLGIVSSAARQPVDVEKTVFLVDAGSADTSKTHFKSFDFMGLGIIEPAQRVRELLDAIAK